LEWLSIHAGAWMQAAKMCTRAGQKLRPEDAATLLQAYTQMKSARGGGPGEN
jgi:hypothetical protein